MDAIARGGDRGKQVTDNVQQLDVVRLIQEKEEALKKKGQLSAFF